MDVLSLQGLYEKDAQNRRACGYGGATFARRTGIQHIRSFEEFADGAGWCLPRLASGRLGEDW